MAKVTVVGSFVMDLVVWVDHFPRRHETQVPTRFEVFPGGKGFNQAITARRCGAKVAMVGKVGADSDGDEFLRLLDDASINSRHVSRSIKDKTSFAVPMINPDGDNSILLIQQANMRLTQEDVMSAAEMIAASNVLMLQLEVPVEASLAAARVASDVGVTTILNPAPAQSDLTELLPITDWLIPNEVEAETLTGVAVTDPRTAVEAGRQLLKQGVRHGVIVTLGSSGSVVVTPTTEDHIPAFAATPVDPTGAGDAFCGAFAVGLAEGLHLAAALRLGNAAGALAVGVAGAEPSLPTREAVDAKAKEGHP